MSEGTKIVPHEVITSVALVNNQLAVRLHQLLSQEKKNVFFSPFSISVTMGMLFSAAEGETASELRTVLGYEHFGIQKDDVAVIFEQVLSVLLQPNASYTLTCANSMLFHKSLNVKDQYKKMLAKSFQALVAEVDSLNENQNVVNQINEWVKRKTNNMIPAMIDFLDPSTALILLNASHFKGAWKKQFKKKNTYPQEFYNKGLKSNVKDVDMMHMEGPFLFYEDRIFQTLQLPFFGTAIAMMIILPREFNGLDYTEENMCHSFFQHLKSKLQLENVTITLPRFRMEYSKSLVSYFAQFGMKRTFSRGAEFTAASDSSDLLVNDILHKAIIEINEEGCEAAAGTKVPIRFGYAADLFVKRTFIANRPFMFIIYQMNSDLILFMGRVNEL